MTNTAEAHAQIRAFGDKYQYDAGYIATILDGSPTAFAAFTAGQGMGALRETLPLDAHFIARIVAMQVDDCGPCTQLNVKMALEAGVDRQLLITLIEDPENLPEPLATVAEYVRSVVKGEAADPDQAAKIRKTYGEAAFVELAVCVAGTRIYPTTKRALQSATTCSPVTVG